MYFHFVGFIPFILAVRRNMFLFVVGSGEVVECTVGTDFSGEGVCGFVGWVAAGGGAVVGVWGCVAEGSIREGVGFASCPEGHCWGPFCSVFFSGRGTGPPLWSSILTGR